MSYIIVTRARALRLAEDAAKRVLEEQKDLRNTAIEHRVGLRKWWLKWCVPLRLFFHELTEKEAGNSEYGPCGVNWWELHQHKTINAAYEIKQLADEAHDGLVRISTEHLRHLG